MCPFLPKECLLLFCDLIWDNQSDFGQLWVWMIKHPGGMRLQTFDTLFRLHCGSAATREDGAMSTALSPGLCSGNTVRTCIQVLLRETAW